MKGMNATLRSIQFIEQNLAQKPDLQTVANAVHYSACYLQRVFTRAVGMSIHDYVVRRKLTEAARLLAFSELPVLQIALSAGYESQQAFTDAFTAMYKVPPHQFRKSEVFYPLQLPFTFQGIQADVGMALRAIEPACETDIPQWMALVRLAVDGFPHLSEADCRQALERCIQEKSAFLMRGTSCFIAGMLLSRTGGSIDFLAVHPLFRGQGVFRAMVERAMNELQGHAVISTTTYREGDRADTGHRKTLLSLGFAAAEPMTEFGYPTQKMILSGENKHV